MSFMQMSPNVMMMNSFSPNTRIPSLQHLNYGIQEQILHHEQHQAIRRINLESKIHDINRRLCLYHNANIPEQNRASWWNSFAFEFFDDQVKIQIHLYDENLPPQKYIFGRRIVPKFFKALFDGGIREMYIEPGVPCKEGISNTYPLIFLDCDNAILHTKHDKPAMIDVQTNIRFLMEFSLDISGYKIKNWIIELRHCHYFNWNDQNQKNDNMILDKLKLGFAHLGLNQNALNTIKMASILESMQMLFFSHKIQGIHPRECIRHTIMQYHFKIQQNLRLQKERMLQQRDGMTKLYNQETFSPHFMVGMKSEESELPQKKTRKRNRKDVLLENKETTTTDSLESSNKKICKRDAIGIENNLVNNNSTSTTSLNDLENIEEVTVEEDNNSSENKRKTLNIEQSPTNINYLSNQQHTILNKPLMQQNYECIPNQK